MFYIEKLRNFHSFSTVYHLQHSVKRFVNYGQNTGAVKNIYIAIGSSLTYTGEFTWMSEVVHIQFFMGEKYYVRKLSVGGNTM